MTAKSAKKNEERVVRVIGDLIKKWQPLLGLHNWTFTYEFQELEENMAMSVNWEIPYKKAAIAVNCDLADEPPEHDAFLEECVVHELAHLVLSPYTNVMRTYIKEDGPLGEALRLAEESLCEDVMALAIRIKERSERTK